VIRASRPVIIKGMEYRLERALAVVKCLATEGIPIQERLVSAMMAMSALQAKDFPKDMRQEYLDLWVEVTSFDSAGKDASIRATVSQMSDEVAEEYAQRIVALLGELADRCEA
jgi:hypothetical protein